MCFCGLLLIVLKLVNKVSVALKDKIKVFLPELVPKLIRVTSVGSFDTAAQNYKSMSQVLVNLGTLSKFLDDYLFLLVSPLTKIVESVSWPGVYQPTSTRIIVFLNSTSTKLYFY